MDFVEKYQLSLEEARQIDFWLCAGIDLPELVEPFGAETSFPVSSMEEYTCFLEDVLGPVLASHMWVIAVQLLKDRTEPWVRPVTEWGAENIVRLTTKESDSPKKFLPFPVAEKIEGITTLQERGGALFNLARTGDCSTRTSAMIRFVALFYALLPKRSMDIHQCHATILRAVIDRFNQKKIEKHRLLFPVPGF